MCDPVKDVIQDMWDRQAVANEAQRLIDKAARVAQDIEWNRMATNVKLRRLSCYLAELSNRAHDGLTTPHNVRAKMAHQYGF